MRGNAFLVLAAALSGAFSAGAGEPVRSYMIVAQPRSEEIFHLDAIARLFGCTATHSVSFASSAIDSCAKALNHCASPPVAW